MPTQLTKTQDARIVRTWRLTGYEVLLPDTSDPSSGSVGIRMTVTSTLGGAPFSVTNEVVAVSGPIKVLAILLDIGAAVRAASQAGATPRDAYFQGTRDALYAWLQREGAIPPDAT